MGYRTKHDLKTGPLGGLLVNLIDTLYPGALNAQAFGVTGDGVTDDQPAIQALFDSIGVNTQIYFPQGTYRLGRQLTLPAKAATHIMGAGMEVTQFMALGNGHDVMFFKDDSEAIHYTLSDFTINCNTLCNKGLVIESSRQGSYTNIKVFRYKERGIEVGTAVADSFVVNYFRNVRVDGGFDASPFPDFGVVLNGGATDNQLVQCYATNNKSNGFFVTQGNNTISQCHVFGAGPTACYRAGGNTELLACHADTPGTAGIEVAGNGVVLLGCHVFANTGHASYNPLAVGIKHTGGNTTTIIGCRFSNVDKEIDFGVGGFIDFRGTIFGNVSTTVASVLDPLDIFTQDLTLSLENETRSGGVRLQVAAGQEARFDLKTADLLRWRFVKDSVAESGSDAGSNLQIARYDDAGVFLGTPIRIDRASGETQIGEALKVTGNLGFYGTTPAGKPTITGSRAGNAALADLLTELANLGLITDSSSV